MTITENTSLSNSLRYFSRNYFFINRDASSIGVSNIKIILRQKKINATVDRIVDAIKVKFTFESDS